MSNTTEKLTGYQILQNKNEALTKDKIELSAKVQELWQKAAYLELDNDTKQKENVAIKEKLEALNAQSRDNILKKNFESERLKRLESENEDLRFQIGYKDAKIEDLHVFQFDFREIEKRFAELKSEKEAIEKDLIELKENSILDKQRFDSLKNENENLKADISGLQKKVVEFNEFKKVQDQLATEKENILKSLNAENAKLKNENADFKKLIGAKNSNMYLFKTVVIFLAVLANFLLLGKKFMGLTGETDWQTYIISYGSVLIFDLTVIFLTMVNRTVEALYFGIGVFILTFFQIGKPFLGIGLDVDFFGFDLAYFERVISGCIYSFFFAFLSYFLSKIKTD